MHIFPKIKGPIERIHLLKVCFLPFPFHSTHYHTCYIPSIFPPITSAETPSAMSTSSCLLIPSFPSHGPPLPPVPCSPLYMLYIPSCWHVEKKQHLRVDADMPTGITQHSEKGPSFLCPAVVAGTSHLCKVFTSSQALQPPAVSKTVPCPTPYFLERFQQFKTKAS